MHIPADHRARVRAVRLESNSLLQSIRAERMARAKAPVDAPFRTGEAELGPERTSETIAAEPGPCITASGLPDVPSDPAVCLEYETAASLAVPERAALTSLFGDTSDPGLHPPAAQVAESTRGDFEAPVAASGETGHDAIVEGAAPCLSIVEAGPEAASDAEAACVAAGDSVPAAAGADREVVKANSDASPPPWIATESESDGAACPEASLRNDPAEGECAERSADAPASAPRDMAPYAAPPHVDGLEDPELQAPTQEEAREDRALAPPSSSLIEAVFEEAPVDGEPRASKSVAPDVAGGGPTPAAAPAKIIDLADQGAPGRSGAVYHLRREAAAPGWDAATDLGALPGAGPGLIWMLQECGVETLVDLAAADATELRGRLGLIGELIDLAGWVDFAKSESVRRAG